MGEANVLPLILIMPESPAPLLRRDIMMAMGAVLLALGSISSFLPVVETNINSDVRASQGTIGRTLMAAPFLIHLKDPTLYPCQKQYPLKPEAGKGLIPIINSLKRQGLLRECNSPATPPS